MIDLAEHICSIKEKKGATHRLDNFFVELAETGAICIEKNKKLWLHCSWLKEDPFTSVMAIKEGASLVVNNNFKIYSGAEIYVNKNASLVLGSGYINNHVNLHCFEKIEIGEDVAIADHVTIRDSDNHLFNGNPLSKMTQPIVIGNHVWIGAGVMILKGVTIGDGAVIAAGAVVTKNIPPGCLAAGIPAKVIRENITWE